MVFRKNKKIVLLTAFFSVFLIQHIFPQQGWITRAPLPNQVTECMSVSLGGKIYVIGGIEPVNISSAKVHIFDPVQNSWSPAAPLPQPRHHVGVAVYNGKIYVFGGYSGSPAFTAVNDVYEYNPQNNMWTVKAPMPAARGANCACEFMGKIHVFGGAGDALQPSYISNYVYDPVMNSWGIGSPMPTARDHHAAVMFDTLIYVIGGRNFSINAGRYDVVEAFSPISNKWYSVSPMNIGRGGPGAEVMNNKIYVFGGEWFSGSGSGLIPEVEEFDPVSGLWDTVSVMPTVRHGIGCSAVGDTIYLIGGGTTAGFSYSDINEGFVPSKIIGIKNISSVAVDFKLYQNYPNPFNPVTKIKFSMPDAGAQYIEHVQLSVFDVTGKMVSTLVNEKLNAGTYEAEWDGTDYPSGIFFYSLIAGNNKSSGKMILIK